MKDLETRKKERADRIRDLITDDMPDDEVANKETQAATNEKDAADASKQPAEVKDAAKKATWKANS